ncbi:MAG: YraN family protein [Phycisphaerales bacterium]|nr:YraN family protein [Phycisphaerales bacterium]
MRRRTIPIGRRGETIACRFLRKHSYRILERNTRIKRLGEVDVICQAPDGCTIVFVEVKTRRSAAVAPEVNVGARKKAKLRILAHAIARNRGWLDRPLRIDVIAVILPDTGRPTIRHHENTVTAC